MKILIITNHSYMFYRFRKELVEQLLKKHQVVLGMPFVGHEEDLAKLGCTCVETVLDRRSANPFKDIQLIARYYKLLKEQKPDMVITYSIKPNIYAGSLCGLMKIPYFANVQGLGTAFQSRKLARIVTAMYKFGLRKVKCVFFENQGNAEEFIRRGILQKDRIQILKGAGINLEYYAQKPYPEEGKTHFLYLGRIMKEKGMDELFAAMERLHKDYGERVMLDLVGFYEDSYKEQVEKLQEQGIVNFHGFQTEPRPYYEAAHCVVLPSYHEGMSNVLLEAAASGRPVITSNIYGCKETVENNSTGFLCRVKDAEDLYQQMNKFMQLTHEQRRSMGQEGRRKMEREFAKEQVVADTIRVLNT